MLRDTFYYIPLRNCTVDEQIATALEKVNQLFPNSSLEITAQAMFYVNKKPVCVFQTAIPANDKRRCRVENAAFEADDVLQTFYEKMIQNGTACERHDSQRHGRRNQYHYMLCAINIASRYYGTVLRTYKESAAFFSLENFDDSHLFAINHDVSDCHSVMGNRQVERSWTEMQEYKVEITLGLEGKSIIKWADSFTEAYDMVKPYVKNDDYDCYIDTRNGSRWLYEGLAFGYEEFRAFRSRRDFDEIVSIARKKGAQGNNHKCKLYII